MQVDGVVFTRRTGRLHCEVVCIFPTNKVLTQVCSFFLNQVRIFLRTVVLDRASFGLQANVVEEYVSLDALLPSGLCILQNSGHIVELLRRLRKTQHGHFSRGFAPFHDRPSVPAGELFAFKFIVSQSSVVDNHPIVLKLGDKEFCVNMDTQTASTHRLPLRVHPSRCHVHDTLIRASGADNIAVTRFVGSVISDLLWIVSLLL